MDRRTFLVGLGKFAGAVLVLPTLPTVFDMGRTQELVLPWVDMSWQELLKVPTLPLSLPTTFTRFHLSEQERGKLINMGSRFNFTRYRTLDEGAGFAIQHMDPTVYQ